MKLLRALEEQRLEEIFNGTRCKQCSVPLGDNPNQMARHPELPEFCQHCGEETLDLSSPDKKYFGEAFAKKTYGPDPHIPHPGAVNLELSWSSKYNGVSMRATDEDFDTTDEMEDAFERIGELADITYDWHPHNSVSDAQEQELINAAREIIGHVIPNANISFDQDDISS